MYLCARQWWQRWWHCERGLRHAGRAPMQRKLGQRRQRQRVHGVRDRPIHAAQPTPPLPSLWARRLLQLLTKGHADRGLSPKNLRRLLQANREPQVAREPAARRAKGVRDFAGVALKEGIIRQLA